MQTSYHSQIKSIEILNLNVKYKTLKLPKDNVGEKCMTSVLRMFLDAMPKA